MKKILYFASAVLALVAVSCNKYEISDNGHQKGEPDVEGCYKVYFPEQEAAGDHTYDPTMDPKVEITVVRQNAKGEITVPYTLVASEPDIFVGTDIKFANGQDTTTFEVSFPNAKTDGTKYAFSIGIDDPQYASKYADVVTDFDFSVMRVEYKLFDKGTLTICAPLGVTNVKQDIELWYYEVAGTRYCKLVNGLSTTSSQADYVFQWDVKTNVLYIPCQSSGYSSGGIDIKLSDAIGFYGGYYGEDYWAGSTKYADWKDYCTKNDLVIAQYDGNGGFFLADWFYYDTASAKSGSGWQFGGESIKDCDSFICKSFTRTDYTIKDIYTDYSSYGISPIEVVTGRDVKSLRYVCSAGELTATQAGKVAQSIQDKTAQGVVTTSDYFYDETDDVNYYDFGVSFANTGTYTVVTVANSTDSTYVYDFASFDYVAAGDVEKLKVKLTVATEDISSRWGFGKTEAFQYYIAGEEIEQLHMAVVPTAKYKASKELYESVIKYSEDYAADEEAIALVNEAGGFASYISGLSANTSYTVLVWAANKVQDAIFTAEYTTDGLPLVLLGTGIYTYNLFWKGYDDEVSLYLDPNELGAKLSTFVLKPFGNDAEFRFQWDGQTSTVKIPWLNNTGASYGSYGTVYCTDATNFSRYEAMGPSSFAADSLTFNFKLAYCVAVGAGYGTLGGTTETFKIVKPVDSSSASYSNGMDATVKSYKKEAGIKSLSDAYPVRTLPVVRTPKISFKAIDREPSTVQFNTVKMSHTPKAKTTEIQRAEIKFEK